MLLREFFNDRFLARKMSQQVFFVSSKPVNFLAIYGKVKTFGHAGIWGFLCFGHGSAQRLTCQRWAARVLQLFFVFAQQKRVFSGNYYYKQSGRFIRAEIFIVIPEVLPVTAVL